MSCAWRQAQARPNPQPNLGETPMNVSAKPPQPQLQPRYSIWCRIRLARGVWVRVHIATSDDAPILLTITDKNQSLSVPMKAKTARILGHALESAADHGEIR